MAILIGILNAIGRRQRAGGSGSGHLDDDEYLTPESGRSIMTEARDNLLWESSTILLSENGFGLLTENYNQLICEQYE
jgi:hypothetical protein